MIINLIEFGDLTDVILIKYACDVCRPNLEFTLLTLPFLLVTMVTFVFSLSISLVGAAPYNRKY